MPGREGETHRPDLAVHLLGDRRHAVEVVTAFGCRARDLLDEHRSGDATPTGRVEGVLHGDVVVDDDGAHGDPLRPGQIGGGLEVQNVARVVLDDVEDPRASVSRLGRTDDRHRCRRGEHFAGNRGVEHAETDEAGVQGLMAAATTADEADLALDGTAGSRDEPRIMGHRDDVGVRSGEPVEGLVHDVGDVVDELLH